MYGLAIGDISNIWKFLKGYRHDGQTATLADPCLTHNRSHLHLFNANLMKTVVNSSLDPNKTLPFAIKRYFGTIIIWGSVSLKHRQSSRKEDLTRNT